MREKTRQTLLADTTTADESLPVTQTLRGPDRRIYAKGRIPDRRKTQRRKEVPVTAENPILAPVLMLEAAAGSVQILAEGSPENDGVMTLRVPFYVGNSVATIAGFNKRFYFPASILADTVARGNARIAAKAPGMTSYARHNHARSGGEVPAGDVIGLTAEGNQGYATIAVNQTRWGQDIQALARAKQLRAVSMRTDFLQADGGYRAVERKVNGELMLEATQLDVSGIDFAPDGAAMPTYGVEVLAAEAAVEPAPTQVPRRTNSMEDITVDGLRAEFPQVVKDIEDPLKGRITELEGKVESLIAAEATRKRDGLLAEIATKTGKELAEVTELFAECKTESEVATKALPLLLEARGTEKTEAKPSPEDRLRAMFVGSGSGQAIQAEVAEEAIPNIGGAAVPSN